MEIPGHGMWHGMKDYRNRDFAKPSAPLLLIIVSGRTRSVPSGGKWPIHLSNSRPIIFSAQESILSAFFALNYLFSRPPSLHPGRIRRPHNRDFETRVISIDIYGFLSLSFLGTIPPYTHAPLYYRDHSTIRKVQNTSLIRPHDADGSSMLLVRSNSPISILGPCDCSRLQHGHKFEFGMIVE